MFNKLAKMSKVTKIALIAIILISIALAIMWWNNKTKTGAEGLTIVTPMPVSGYSVEDVNNGLPDSLEEPLVSVSPTTDTASLQPIDVISSAAPLQTSAAPSVETEEFESFASSKWRGTIL